MFDYLFIRLRTTEEIQVVCNKAKTEPDSSVDFHVVVVFLAQGLIWWLIIVSSVLQSSYRTEHLLSAFLKIDQHVCRSI